MSLYTLRLGDSDSNVATVISTYCINAHCEDDMLPVVELRRRATIVVSDDGDLEELDEEGAPRGTPADEIFYSEGWLLVREGVLPGGTRSDGLLDETLPGRLSSGGNFCSVGVQAGDLLTITDPPVDIEDADCQTLRAAWEADPELMGMTWRVEHVRSDALYLELLGEPGAVDILPSRTCFPFGATYQIRPDNQWVMEAEFTDGLHALRTVSGACVPQRPGDVGPGRVEEGVPFRNAYFDFTLAADTFEDTRDVAVTFGVVSGYSGLRLAIGPLPGDVEVMDAPERKLVVVPDAGSNQIFVFDAETFSSLESL